MNRTATTTRTATKPARQVIRLATAERSLAAFRAHATRAALAILNGDHSETTVERFVALSKEVDVLTKELA